MTSFECTAFPECLLKLTVWYTDTSPRLWTSTLSRCCTRPLICIHPLPMKPSSRDFPTSRELWGRFPLKAAQARFSAQIILYYSGLKDPITTSRICWEAVWAELICIKRVCHPGMKMMVMIMMMVTGKGLVSAGQFIFLTLNRLLHSSNLTVTVS